MALFQSLEVSPQVDPTGVVLSLRGAFPDSYITVPSGAPSSGVPIAPNQAMDVILQHESQISAAAALSLGFGQYFDLSASANLSFLQCLYLQLYRVPPDPGATTVIQNFYYGAGFRVLIAAAGVEASLSVSIAAVAANIELNGLASSVLVQAYGLTQVGLAPIIPLIAASTGGFGAATMSSYIDARDNLTAMLSHRKDLNGNPLPLYPRLLAVDLDTTDYDIYSRAAVGLMGMKQLADNNAPQTTSLTALQSELGTRTLGSAAFDPAAALGDAYSSFYTLCGDAGHSPTVAPTSNERSLAKSLVG